jgi:hypothetical protein
MSTTDAQTYYSFSVNSDQAAEPMVTLQVPGSSMDDAAAGAFYETLKAIVWPTYYTNITVSVQKYSYSNTSYATDTNVNPPTFS